MIDVIVSENVVRHTSLIQQPNPCLIATDATALWWPPVAHLSEHRRLLNRRADDENRRRWSMYMHDAWRKVMHF
jgi:hypothetical protein